MKPLAFVESTSDCSEPQTLNVQKHQGQTTKPCIVVQLCTSCLLFHIFSETPMLHLRLLALTTVMSGTFWGLTLELTRRDAEWLPDG